MEKKTRWKAHSSILGGGPQLDPCHTATRTAVKRSRKDSFQRREGRIAERRALPPAGTSGEVARPMVKAAATPIHVTATSQLKGSRKAEISRSLPSKGTSNEVTRYMAKAAIKPFDRMHVQLPHQLKSYNDDVRPEAYKPPTKTSTPVHRERDTSSGRSGGLFPFQRKLPCPRIRWIRHISAVTVIRNIFALSGTVRWENREASAGFRPGTAEVGRGYPGWDQTSCGETQNCCHQSADAPMRN